MVSAVHYGTVLYLAYEYTCIVEKIDKFKILIDNRHRRRVTLNFCFCLG